MRTRLAAIASLALIVAFPGAAQAAAKPPAHLTLAKAVAALHSPHPLSPKGFRLVAHRSGSAASVISPCTGGGTAVTLHDTGDAFAAFEKGNDDEDADVQVFVFRTAAAAKSAITRLTSAGKACPARVTEQVGSAITIVLTAHGVGYTVGSWHGCRVLTDGRSLRNGVLQAGGTFGSQTFLSRGNVVLSVNLLTGSTARLHALSTLQTTALANLTAAGG